LNAIRRRLRAFVWLALSAMAGLTLGPSISRALEPGGRLPHEHHMASHAHPSAMPHAHAVAGGRSDAPADPSCMLDCCALCGVAATPFAVAAAFVAPRRAQEGPSLQVAEGSHARPGGRGTWSSATPRGPPTQA
jgi:hypothetical protein